MFWVLCEPSHSSSYRMIFSCGSRVTGSMYLRRGDDTAKAGNRQSGPQSSFQLDRSSASRRRRPNTSRSILASRTKLWMHAFVVFFPAQPHKGREGGDTSMQEVLRRLTAVWQLRVCWSCATSGRRAGSGTCSSLCFCDASNLTSSSGGGDVSSTASNRGHQ